MNHVMWHTGETPHSCQVLSMSLFVHSDWFERQDRKNESVIFLFFRRTYVPCN